MKIAYFAAGCFWGIEDEFSKIAGVIDTKVGYMGGDFKNPTYNDVCLGETNHAETVKVIYDESLIKYNELLDVFWNIHNPTTLNRQGWDIGIQYRSVIFYIDDEQKKIAEENKFELDNSNKYKNSIVTEIIKADIFWEAEEYHQKYISKRKGL
jgi:peptide-methionine (S)-S-oxide reductase